MLNPSRSPQFDLFEEMPEQPSRRRDNARHEPTVEQIRLAKAMSAAGHRRAVIAQALGIGLSTLDRHYVPDHLSKLPIGRPRHAPTPATCKIVRRAFIGGMPLAGVAKLIGITVPTLHLHYRDELQP